MTLDGTSFLLSDHHVLPRFFKYICFPKLSLFLVGAIVEHEVLKDGDKQVTLFPSTAPAPTQAPVPPTQAPPPPTRGPPTPRRRFL